MSKKKYFYQIISLFFIDITLPAYFYSLILLLLSD